MDARLSAGGLYSRVTIYIIRIILTQGAMYVVGVGAMKLASVGQSVRRSVPRNGYVCGTLKCENAAICEKVAKCEKYSTLNVKIDAICEKITLNVKKLGSLNVSNISTLNVLKSTLYVQTLFWRYLWKSNFSACQISER